MTAIAPAAARNTRTRWSARDSWNVSRRHLLHLVVQPSQLIGNIASPVVMVLLFGLVLGSAMSIPGGGNYREFLMPGLFTMTMALGIAQTVLSVATDTSKGITDRFRTLPVAGSSIVVGRSTADLVTSMLDLVVLALCGLAIGWRPHGTLWETLAAFGLLLLLRYALAWVGVYVGLALPTPELAGLALAALYPLAMISSIFLAPEQLPSVLGVIANWNPLSATANAARELFGNPGVTGAGSWPSEHALLLAVCWPVALTSLFAPLAARRYRRLGG